MPMRRSCATATNRQRGVNEFSLSEIANPDQRPAAGKITPRLDDTVVDLVSLPD